ncbi:MAG: ABC transporter permease [Desulfonatronovibrionaceae bacterium]
MFGLALRNLFRSRLRNLLTFIGVAAGMSVLMASVSVTSNFRNQLDEIIADTGSDVMIQSRTATTPMTSRISAADLQKISALDSIKSTSSVIMGFLQTSWAPYFLILGVSSAESLASRVSLLEGEWFSPQKQEMVLGYLGAAELGYSTGNKMVLNDRNMFTITGLFSFGYPMADGAALMDLSTAKKLLNRDNSVNMILTEISPATDPYQAIQELNSLFPHLYASTGKDFVGEIRFFDSVELFTWILSTVSFLTCCLVVMNTLIMSISERIKELGILMAIGWSRLMIYRTILYESLILCLAGTIAGAAAAGVSLSVLQGSRTLGLGLIPAGISWNLAILSCGLALLLGVVSSLYPALIINRVTPAGALRYE